MRARNLDVEPIKVNDKIGNPILIGLVLVWKLKDTYKAMFDIDAQTMADKNGAATVAGRMNAFEAFVRVQSDAALRQVAGEYAYDDDEQDVDGLTLRGGGDEINDQLEKRLNERLAMAGMEIVEARINYLAYAPEIAAVMLLPIVFGIDGIWLSVVVAEFMAAFLSVVMMLLKRKQFHY